MSDTTAPVTLTYTPVEEIEVVSTVLTSDSDAVMAY